MKVKEIWYWYWGFDQSNIQIHSEKLVFTEFNKMKEYSTQHSYEHKWIGNGYWSNYDKVEISIDELEEAKKRLKKILHNHVDIVKLTGDKYNIK